MSLQRLNTFSIPKGFRGKSALICQLWWICQDTLFRLSPQALYGWRRFLLRLFGARIGKSVIIRPTVRVTYPWKLIIGDYAWIGDNVELYNLGQIQIGSHSVISQRSYLCTGSHDYQSTDFAIYSRDIVVEDSCWIATDVFIAPGVRVGTGAVIGARSSLFENAAPGCIYIGNPARNKRFRFTQE